MIESSYLGVSIKSIEDSKDGFATSNLTPNLCVAYNPFESPDRNRKNPRIITSFISIFYRKFTSNSLGTILLLHIAFLREYIASSVGQ